MFGAVFHLIISNYDNKKINQLSFIWVTILLSLVFLGLCPLDLISSDIFLILASTEQPFVWHFEVSYSSLFLAFSEWSYFYRFQFFACRSFQLEFYLEHVYFPGCFAGLLALSLSMFSVLLY